MSNGSRLLGELIDALRCLPGVGAKSAQRMAFHLLERERQAYREQLLMQERAAIADAQAHVSGEAADEDDVTEDDDASAGTAAEAEQ